MRPKAAGGFAAQRRSLTCQSSVPGVISVCVKLGPFVSFVSFVVKAL